MGSANACFTCREDKPTTRPIQVCAILIQSQKCAGKAGLFLIFLRLKYHLWYIVHILVAHVPSWVEHCVPDITLPSDGFSKNYLTDGSVVPSVVKVVPDDSELLL